MAPKPAHERLRAWREASELSQLHCANEIGVGQPTWCAWERGDKIPTVDFCFSIEKLTKGVVPASAWATAAALKRGAA